MSRVHREPAYLERLAELQRTVEGLREPLVLPGRRFLAEGVLLKSCRRGWKPRAFFLFSDLFFYAAVDQTPPGTCVALPCICGCR
jgi:hypothetical protein